MVVSERRADAVPMSQARGGGRLLDESGNGMRAQRAKTRETSLPREALVIGAEEGRARVRLLGADGLEVAEESVRVAVSGYLPTPGDRVLVQWSASGNLFVTGVIHAAKPPALATSQGGSASLEGDVIVLRSAAGDVLARYDGAADTLSLRGASHVHLSAPEGTLRLTARDHVEIQAGEGSRLRLSPHQIELRADDAAFAVGRWELRADRMIQRVGDALLNVERLCETRAERMRSIVRGTLEMVGRRTTIRSEKDTRIDGERVLLG